MATTSLIAGVAGEALKARILNRTARAGVIGLGYVGLPLAVELAEAGFSADVHP
jgi:UDP-glucose/GDP-mannose dehydrogenase family, NAD binding domain